MEAVLQLSSSDIYITLNHTHQVFSQHHSRSLFVCSKLTRSWLRRSIYIGDSSRRSSHNQPPSSLNNNITNNTPNNWDQRYIGTKPIWLSPIPTHVVSYMTNITNIVSNTNATYTFSIEIRLSANINNIETLVKKTKTAYTFSIDAYLSANINNIERLVKQNKTASTDATLSTNINNIETLTKKTRMTNNNNIESNKKIWHADNIIYPICEEKQICKKTSKTKTDCKQNKNRHTEQVNMTRVRSPNCSMKHLTDTENKQSLVTSDLKTGYKHQQKTPSPRPTNMATVPKAIASLPSVTIALICILLVAHAINENKKRQQT